MIVDFISSIFASLGISTNMYGFYALTFGYFSIPISQLCLLIFFILIIYYSIEITIGLRHWLKHIFNRKGL